MRPIHCLAFAFAVVACAPAPDQAPPTPAVAPTATVDRLLEDVRILSADDMQGRMVGSSGGAKARAYLLGRLREIGVTPALGDSFEHGFQTQRDGKDLTGVNLLAVVEGAAASERALIVVAHYDHVGVRGGQIYNGADDNASGVASLLAIAASLKETPPQHDVILALVDA